MGRLYYVPFFMTLLLLYSCSGTKTIVQDSEAVEYEEDSLDTLYVTAPRTVEEDEEDEIPQFLPYYNPSHERHMDLLHTILDIGFNWKEQLVLGKADITMTPYFYPQSSVVLDAKGFEIHDVKMGEKILTFDYDGMKLEIYLDREYTLYDTLTIHIDYTAQPEASDGGGSFAISSDKGLFFINPLGTDVDKPMQIWTQGETEHNSRWFPTFDKPNERMSQQISLTVEDKFVTLSNGLLISSVHNSDGTRTDTWKQELPHAPYLFMVAIGEYAVVSEMWNDIELLYYVEPQYEESAKEIFNHTAEMLTFFSNMLNYPYPWDKYAQVVTRDYVSGAMENTSAVIFGDFVQKSKRDLIDNDNDYIVAHEIFHHWFGNIVTCESWSNLTLQEGLANYSEYLWFEYKYGMDRAEDHRLSQLEGYLMSAENEGTRPIIDFEYLSKEDMFDAHSYNKGGLVLHMLREYLGEDAFYEGLKTYLNDNAFTAVEVHHLRLAFEKVSGKDLNWFFNQWFLSKGHPVLDVEYSYDESTRELTISIDQVQDTESHLPIYRLELEVALYYNDGVVVWYPLSMVNRSNEYIIDDIDQPAVVVLDGRNTQLAIINEDKSPEEYLAQFKLSDQYADKYEALRFLRNSQYFNEMIDQLLDEDYFLFRRTGVDGINFRTHPEKVEHIKKLITEDPHSAVRNAALQKSSNYDYEMAKPHIIEVLKGDDAYSLVSTALSAIYNNERQLAVDYAIEFKDENSTQLISVLANIFANSGDPAFLDFFESQLNGVSLFSMFNFYNKYYDLVSKLDVEKRMNAVELMSNIALHGTISFRRFAAMNFINRIKNTLIEDDEMSLVEKVQNIMNHIIENETNEDVKMRYQSF